MEAAAAAQSHTGPDGRVHRRASANVLRADTSRVDVLKGVTWNEEIRFVLAKLEGGKIYQDIQVRAVNGAGLLSDTESFLIKRVSLKTPTRDRVLLKEYRRCLLSAGMDFFDSHFYFHGAFQRFGYDDAVWRLRNELDKIGVTEEAQEVYETCQEELAERSASEEEEEDVDLRVKDEADRLRRRQFRYKIKRLLERRDMLLQANSTVRQRQLSLQPDIRAWDKKQRELEREMDRVMSFKGDVVDSDSLQGRNFKYKREDLVRLLNDKVEELTMTVQHGKMELMLLTQEFTRTSAAVTAAQEAFEERVVGFFRYRNEVYASMDRVKNMKRLRKAPGLLRESKQSTFTHWAQHAALSQNMRRCILNMFRRWAPHRLSLAFVKW